MPMGLAFAGLVAAVAVAGIRAMLIYERFAHVEKRTSASAHRGQH